MKKILKLFVLAVMLAVPAMASAADQLPKGFIAVSKSKMTWDQAKAWCQQRGGRLPLIGGRESLSSDPWPGQGTPIDGFGAVGTLWSVGLPSDLYWTGTADSFSPGRSWNVYADGGEVIVYNAFQSHTHRVVCIP